MRAMASQVEAEPEATQGIATDSGSVADAARTAQHNVEAVAAATEQLGASIREITQQSSGAGAATRLAAGKGAEGRERIATLSREVDRIGGVARLIADIAAQTNLLALNATIEASQTANRGARRGDNGSPGGGLGPALPRGGCVMPVRR